jgi:hypothetical protein
LLQQVSPVFPEEFVLQHFCHVMLQLPDRKNGTKGQEQEVSTTADSYAGTQT